MKKKKKSLHGWFMEERKLDSISLDSQSKALPYLLSPKTCTIPSRFPGNLTWVYFNSGFPSMVHFSHSRNPKAEEDRQKDSDTGEVKDKQRKARRFSFWSSAWANTQPLRFTSSLGVKKSYCSYLIPRAAKEIK